MFCEYCGFTPMLQVGVAQVATIVVVPPVFVVTVAELVVVLVPRLTEATPVGTELQVKEGLIETPLESITSATKDCVFVGARLKVVFELLAS